MIRNLLRWRFAPLLIPLAAGLCLPAQIQDDSLIKKSPEAPAIAPTPEMVVQSQTDATLPSQATDLFIRLLVANSLKETRAPADSAANQDHQASPESGKPKPMTMLSISCYQQSEKQASQALLIRCRTDGYISNAAGGARFVIKGVVTEDVVSAGKILISAGSKVAGIGHVDADTGRVESKGDWAIIAENHELRVHAELQDADGGFHGLPGKETSFESELSQRQAVVRDGRYCFLADKTPFALSITGDVSITDLQSLESPE
jgi:hypothetical protein